jgi:superfamily II DNA or RNA helicase
LIVSPTGSGKSLILYIIHQYLERVLGFKNILIVVPTVGLVTQLKSDFIDYAKDDESFNSDSILMIPNKRNIKYNSDCNTTITTWQSLLSEVKGPNRDEFFSKYEALIVDEVHTMQANVSKEIALSCNQTLVKIGMTGTLSNTKVGELGLKGLFGSVYKTTTTADLINDGSLCDVTIKAIRIDHLGFETETKKMDFHTEIDFIRNNITRNTFICKLAEKITASGNTLVLYQNHDQGNAIHEYLVENSKFTIFKVNGDTPIDQREYVRKYAENNDGVIIVAQNVTFATGVNIKNLHNLIFGAPSKSMIKILQSIGRTLRTHHSKEMAMVYDIYDHIQYKRKSDRNHTLLHFTERYKIYTQVGLNIDIIQGPKIKTEVD